MKENYENIPNVRLTRRTPVAIRIDGKSFHTFCRGFKKPFDDILIKTMQETMQYLCENIQGCVFGYTQSDEITLILVDYAKLESSAWFDYKIQKLCSIAASMATMSFNKRLIANLNDVLVDVFIDGNNNKDNKYIDTYCRAINKGAMFDARCFNIPKEEVTNLIYWRQLDATRNSIQMVAQANFSHKEIQGLSCNQLQNKLLTEKNINWNDLPIVKKRGSACIKDKNNHWFIDKEMPILKDDRNYIDKLIFVNE